MITRLLLLTITGLLVATSIQAEVYRWVDERGKVHFGDQPQGGGAQKLEIGEPQTSPGGIDQQSMEAEQKMQQRRLLDSYREERESRYQERLKSEAAERQRSKNCAYARNRLRKYRISRLYEPLDDGGRRYLNSDERQHEINQAQAAVQHWCDS